MRLRKGNSKLLNEEKELVKFLAKVNLFKSLSKNERKNLTKYIYVRKFKKDENVFKKGYPNVAFYIVKEGHLKVYLDESKGGLHVNELKPLDFFGEISLFVEEARTASVAAIEDSVLLAISKKDLEDFIAHFPRTGIKVLYKFGEILCSHITRLNQKLNE
jgi:CRP-like cAMP-binding protein